MRVGLVTSWAPEKCGVATYSEELVAHVREQAPDIEFKIIARPFTAQSILERVQDVDIVHINHVHAFFGDLKPAHIRQMKAMGKKTVCSWQECTSENRSEFTLAFDRVTVHLKDTADGFQYIPSGIWTKPWKPYTGEFKDYIGMAGFPFGFKKFDLGARVARHFGLKLLAFMPESQHTSAAPEVRKVHELCPGSITFTDYKHQTEIVELLSQCRLTLHPHDHAGGGVSGSVRLGLAGRRPTVITKAGRFMDLWAYEDEVYIVQSGYPSISDIIPVVGQVLSDESNNTVKLPKRVIEDMSWERCARDYIGVYRDVIRT